MNANDGYGNIYCDFNSIKIMASSFRYTSTFYTEYSGVIVYVVIM